MHGPYLAQGGAAESAKGDHLPKHCQIASYQLAYSYNAITEFWLEALSPADELRTEEGTGLNDEDSFDIHAIYRSNLEGTDTHQCALYQLSGPQGYLLELQHDEEGRLILQRGQLALQTFSSDHVQITYHPIHGQVTSLLNINHEGEASYGHYYEIDDEGILLSHSSSQPHRENEISHREEFVYECR